jgi:hypothetical protein
MGIYVLLDVSGLHLRPQRRVPGDTRTDSDFRRAMHGGLHARTISRYSGQERVDN